MQRSLFYICPTQADAETRAVELKLLGYKTVIVQKIYHRNPSKWSVYGWIDVRTVNRRGRTLEELDWHADEDPEPTKKDIEALEEDPLCV